MFMASPRKREVVDITWLNGFLVEDLGVGLDAGIEFQADGDVHAINSGGSADSGDWVTPKRGTPGNRYWIRATLNSGSLDSSPGTGTWIAMSSSLQWSTGAGNTANLDFDIASDSGGTNIVSSCSSVTLNATGV